MIVIHTGRHFLQIPGPTNVPDRVLRAIDQPVIDHRGPEFAKLAGEVLEGLRPIFQTRGPVVIYPGSGTGAWEASIVNTLSPGDRVLMFETGHFSNLWRGVAGSFGVIVEYVSSNWRHGAVPEDIEKRLADDKDRSFKAVMIVHNETSTGVTSRIPEIRSAIDRARHPALFPNHPTGTRLRGQTFLLSEFLEHRAAGYQPPRLPRRVLLHGHCHQKALMKMTHAESLLRKMGAEVQSIDSGCCGMAGPFGFEREKYAIAQASGERVLLPAVRQASPDTLIISDGFSCREQIFQSTGRRALHLAEAIVLAAKSLDSVLNSYRTPV